MDNTNRDTHVAIKFAHFAAAFATRLVDSNILLWNTSERERLALLPADHPDVIRAIDDYNTELNWLADDAASMRDLDIDDPEVRGAMLDALSEFFQLSPPEGQRDPYRVERE